MTNIGRPVAILATVGETNGEESRMAIRSARATAAAAALQKRSVAQGLDKLRPDEIEGKSKRFAGSAPNDYCPRQQIGTYVYKTDQKSGT